MRHRRVGRKLGVKSKHRKSMFRNMATELLKHDRIKTSDVRAKEIRRVVEKLITLAKKGTLESRRKAEGYIRDKEAVKKLFGELAERFKERPGGYTRIVKLGYRRGDNTPISLIEIIEDEYKPKKKKRKTTAKKKESEDTSAKTAKSSKKESAEELGLVDNTNADDGQDEQKSEDVKVEAKESDVKEDKTEQADTETDQSENVDDSPKSEPDEDSKDEDTDKKK